jgi:hypothetical protein
LSSDIFNLVRENDILKCKVEELTGLNKYLQERNVQLNVRYKELEVSMKGKENG